MQAVTVTVAESLANPGWASVSVEKSQVQVTHM